MTTANKVPTTGIHHGANGGKASTSKAAVTAALPSLRNGQIGRPRILSMSHSALYAVISASDKCTARLGPKKYIHAAAPGTNASSTRVITWVTDVRWWLWGELAVLNFMGAVLRVLRFFYRRLTRRSRRIRVAVYVGAAGRLRQSIVSGVRIACPCLQG